MDHEHTPISQRSGRARSLRAMFDRAGIGMAFVDVDDKRLLYANAAFSEIVGYSGQELEGMTLLDLTHVEDEDGDAGALEELVRGEISRRVVEKRYVRKDRSLVWVRLNTTIVEVEGASVALTVAEDISERKLAEARLEASESRLRSVNHGKDVFLASLAHELRNPLAAIRSSVDVMRQLRIEDRHLQVIVPILERQSKQLSRLIDDVLDASRMTAGKVVLDRSRLLLTEALEPAIDAIGPMIDKRGQSLVIDLPGEPLYVKGDAARLTQVFANLLDNACKYTPPGGRIALVVHRRGREVRAVVQDSGDGISDDLLPHVFDLFSQAAKPGQPSRGLGIGLTIVKKLVTLHGGRISVASEVGKGSAFEVALPIDNAAGQAQPAKPVIERALVPPLSILVVDDNEDAASSLAMCLQMSGHAVRVAGTGEEAIRLARKLKPDVSLLDIDLPDMTGYELARALKRGADTADIALVAVTGHTGAIDGDALTAAGFARYLLKPVTTAQLDLVFTLVAKSASKGTLASS